MSGPMLRDIHVPAASWWPPAPGWWLVATLVLLLALGVAWLVRRRAVRAPLRAALAEVDAIEAAWRSCHDAGAAVDAASRLLRRVARRVDPGIAARAGTPWRQFVDHYARDPAARATLDRLLDARFRRAADTDVPALCRALRGWCRAALATGGAAARAPSAAVLHGVPGR